MLSETDRAVLDVEGRFWKYQGAKEAAIRAELDLSPVRYYQRLARLADDPAALEHAPLVVARIRRRRSAGVRARSTGAPLPSRG